MSDEKIDWEAAAAGQSAVNTFCPHCCRDKFGPNACDCPGSGLLAGGGGPLDLGIERSALAGTNNFKLFFEEFTSIANIEPDQ